MIIFQRSYKIFHEKLLKLQLLFLNAQKEWEKKFFKRTFGHFIFLIYVFLYMFKNDSWFGNFL